MHLFTNWTDSSTFFLAPPLPKENIKKPLKKINSSKREEKKGNQPKTLSTIYISRIRRKEKKKRERKRNRVNKSSSPPDHLDTLVAISGYEKKKKKKKNLTYNFARLLGGKLS